MVFPDTLKPAVGLNLNIFDDLHANGLFPHVEVMGSAAVNKNSDNFMRFRVNDYQRFNGMMFLLAGVISSLLAIWALNRAFRNVNYDNLKVFVCQKRFFPGRLNLPLFISTFSTHTVISWAVLSATPYSTASDKNVTYSRQYLHASKSISATSSLAFLPRRLCFAAYASRKIPTITCIVAFVKPCSRRNCLSLILSDLSNFVSIPSYYVLWKQKSIFRRSLLNHEIREVSAFALTGEITERQFYLIIWESAANDGEKELLRRAHELENRFSGCEIVAELCGQGPIIRLLNLFANPNYAHLEDDDVTPAIPFITGERERSGRGMTGRDATNREEERNETA